MRASSCKSGGAFVMDGNNYFRKDVVPDMGAKMKEYCSSQEEVQTEGNTNTQVDEIKNLRLNQLVNFKDHPFKVETNTELFELMQSIEKDGVLVPLLARPNPNGEGYELIFGHRRKAACEWVGVTEVPVIIRDLDKCQAAIAMVDSNLQRENIKPSEKGPVTLSLEDYAGMEKVGNLGTSLPRYDEQMNTSAGDIILYQGRSFVIYYGTNSWSLTRLGKIENISADELKEALGIGNVDVTLSLK